MSVRLIGFWISSKRDIVVVDDSTRNCLCLRDPNPLASILAIVDPPFLREAKHFLKISTLVLTVSCKSRLPSPRCYSEFHIRVGVTLECLANVVQTVHCVLIGLARCSAILGGEIVSAYRILVAQINIRISWEGKHSPGNEAGGRKPD